MLTIPALLYNQGIVENTVELKMRRAVSSIAAETCAVQLCFESQKVWRCFVRAYILNASRIATLSGGVSAKMLGVRWNVVSLAIKV